MTDREIDEEILDFHFIAIATATYDDLRLENLPQTRGEVEALAGWFCDEKLADRAFTHRHKELASDPTKEQIEAALSGPCAGREWRESDAVVVYVTGHGMKFNGEHWVLLRSTKAEAIAKKSLRISDLISWLMATDIQHLLVIIDLCYAGDMRGIGNIEASFRKTWVILASAEKNQEALPFALTNAIQQALDEMRGEAGAKYGHDTRFLTTSAFLDAVQRKLGDQWLIPVAGRLTGRHVCLPNPHFEPSAVRYVSPPRRDLAVPSMDMEEHWGPRARGGTRGWFFAGRVDLMKRLIAAATTEEPGAVLVTGGAGSGKSAVLARLVTLTDPEFRSRYAEDIALIPPELLPAAEAVDVAVLATGKNATQIMTQICAATGALDTAEPGDSPASDPLDRAQKAWWSWLRLTGKRVTIVVDALDEAAVPDEVLTQVLRKLEDPRSVARDVRQVRLIVGVRSLGSSGGPAPGGAPLPVPATRLPLADRVQRVLEIDPGRGRIQVDEEPWWVRQDIVDYISRVLRLSPGSPYAAAAHAEVEAVAGIVAGKAGQSFLFAKMAADQLADPETAVNIHDPAWLSSIRQGVLGLFRWDLHHSLPDDPEQRLRAVHLFRAVAFAFGPGLPWLNIWPLVASAVAGEEGRYEDRDIVWLLGTRLGGYLVTDRADEVTVYRLFHDELRGILREHWEELL